MPERGAVAVIGLGNMGFPMVGRLVAAGEEVRGFDVAPDAVARLAEVGAAGADSAADAARGAGVVVLMLPNSRIVTSVVDDLLAADALVEGSILVDMSSSEPTSTRELAERLAPHGVALVDAPVSGGVKGAVAGTLTIMVGGEDAAVDRVLPVVTALGTAIRCGGVGAGHAVKALNNLLSATHLWATSEAMEAGAAFGLDPEVMLAVFNRSSGRSGSTENKWPNFVLPGTYDSGFGLGLMLKDMRIALGLAEATGTTRRLSADAVELWADAASHLPATADHTEIARWVAVKDAHGAGPTAAPGTDELRRENDLSKGETPHA
ncbi:NAD(P)-dependent oxidoreductase [Microbacterium sp. CJ88]|uniref:NAD(P)-dependent oxidoreductase n=1 Tax=Microbacterium sp. CJ88 TaxID=3445672 RepID=UPI003F65A554